MDWYIGTEWTSEAKGLHKLVTGLNFTKLIKPSEFSKVEIQIHSVENLNSRPSAYLSTALDSPKTTQIMTMGTALTPIDVYLELLVRQMMLGERALCSIKTAAQSPQQPPIQCDVTLQKILETKPVHEISVREMYERALLYKQNGVSMFKEYPIFAHHYFARAAKCLCTYKPFENLSLEKDGIDCKDMQELFLQLQTNLAACLLQQKRYEDVIYQTQHVETSRNPSEKSVYRRALAFYGMQEFEKAQATIESWPNYEQNKDFLTLMGKVKQSWKNSNEDYKKKLSRMFN